MKIFNNITTDRLTLRELKRKDIFLFSELFNDQETIAMFGSAPFSNELELGNLIEKYQSEFQKGESIFWTITLTEDREFIGFVRIMNYSSHYFDLSYRALGPNKYSPEFLELFDIENGWEVDYALIKDYWNMGIMSEALKSILCFCDNRSIHPLYAKVHDLENIPTVSILKKCGFNEHIPQTDGVDKLGMIFKK